MRSQSTPAHRAKTILDVLVTAAIGVAAVVLAWRTWMGPSRPPPPPTSVPAFEEIASTSLTTLVDGEPFLGSSMAPVVLIEYSDFECPFCARYASEMFDAIRGEFVESGRVEYVFRNYPIEQIHPSATKAAHAAGCAHRQGRFLEMRALLFANHRTLAGIDWDRVASDAGLQTAPFHACLRAADVAVIQAEKDEAERLGVSSTPTFLIGTRSRDGRVRIAARSRGAPPYPVFKDSLEQALAAIAKDMPAGQH